MPAEPAIRASLLRTNLQRVAELSPEDAAAARAALGPEALARIEHTPGHDFLPLALDVAIIHAVHARRGDEGVLRLGREQGRAVPENPLVRPLVTAMLGMLGRRPAVLLDIAVAGWAIASRNTGRLRVVSRSHQDGCLGLTELPEVMRDRALLLRMGSSVEPLFESAGLRARLDVEWEPGASRALLRYAWSRGGP